MVTMDENEGMGEESALVKEKRINHNLSRHVLEEVVVRDQGTGRLVILHSHQQRYRGPMQTQSCFLKLHILLSISHHCGYFQD